MDFQTEHMDEAYYVYSERSATPGPEIAAEMAAGFGVVHAFTEARGMTRLSPPIAVYVDMPSAGLMAFRTGVFVSEADAQRAEGAIEWDRMPEGIVVKTVHTGPYTTLNETHQALWSHMDQAGLTKAMPIWEVYIDDPETSEPSDLRTEVYRRLG